MKRNSLLDTIKAKIIDPNASTLEEIMRDTNQCRGAVSKLRDKGLADGTWEEVWKVHGPRLTRAYRRGTKKKK